MTDQKHQNAQNALRARFENSGLITLKQVSEDLGISKGKLYRNGITGCAITVAGRRCYLLPLVEIFLTQARKTKTNPNKESNND